MRGKFLLAFTLVFLVCVPVHVVFTQSEEWLSIENEYFVVNYHPGYEDDAVLTLDTAMLVRNITLEKYPHELGFKVVIYIYSSREEFVGGLALSEVSSSSGVIRILRPSWDGHWGGYEQLDDPFKRVLNHEYVHVPFYVDLYSKSAGFYDTPSWFSQGVAEFISQNYLPTYVSRVQDAVQDGDFTVNEPYSWGIYIVEFMYAEYGAEKIVDLIKSNASSFALALGAELGVTPLEFEQKWRIYIADLFDVMYLPSVDDEFYAYLLSEYEALNSTYYQLVDDFDELAADHETLLDNYNGLDDDYSQLSADYDELKTNYDEVLANYTKVTSNLTSLQTDYNSLNSSYNSLSATSESLQSDYQKLQTSHSSLQSSYDTLQAMYDSLNATYTSLISEEDANDIDGNLVYIFIVAIAIITIIVHIIIRKYYLKPT